MTNVFYGDVSRWNRVVNSTYKFPILCFRVDSGFDTDPLAHANWAECLSNPAIRMGIAYVVHVPGHEAEIVARVKALFGPVCPKYLAFMVDEESGSGFAGPGNHSVGANKLAALLAEYAGDDRRVIGYANKGDWAAGWPQHPLAMKRITASYGLLDPNTYGWQYNDGSLKWAWMRGYPHVAGMDMNVIHRPIEQILEDFGLDWLSMATQAEVQAIVKTETDKIYNLLRASLLADDQHQYRVETLVGLALQKQAAQAAAK